MAIALIVVGPEKLPELAKTLAKQMVELKRAANALKDSLQEEEEDTPAWKKISPEHPQIAEHTSPAPQAQPGDQMASGQGQTDEKPTETGSAPKPSEKSDAASG